MKIKVDRKDNTPKLYNIGDTLAANSFYEDEQKRIYWTDDTGQIAGGISDGTFLGAGSVAYPLRDSNVTSITLSK